jgi:serine/threonine-protein kinase
MGKKIFGNYEILKKLGEGGMGAVYLARDLSLQRKVAIKIIAPELSRHARLISRFQVEAVAQAKLNHTNIVTIHSFSQEKNIYYIVMEYVEGISLKEAINEKIPVLQSLKIFTQLLEAVDYAHSQGVIHRDIKPANVFLAPDQTAKIGDFGIAKVEGVEGITRTGTGIGSPVYSAPEQILGETIDGRTDIYSLGVTLYEMLTGAPYLRITGDTDYTALKKALEYKPPKPSTINPDIPPELDAIVMKSIAKDPAHRFQDANEFNREVKQLIASLTPVPGTPTGEETAPQKKWPGTSTEIEMRQPKTLVFNKQLAITIASFFIGIIFITFVILLVSNGSPPSVQTGPGTETSEPVRSTTGSAGLEKHPVVQPPKAAEEKPRVITEQQPDTAPETPTITEMDSLSLPETIKKMDWYIKTGHYQQAINLGHKTSRDGTASGDIYGEIYSVMSQAYYCDGKKEQARIYYMKALEHIDYLNFNAYYHYKKNFPIKGTLGISKQNIYFTPANENLSRYAFTLSMGVIHRVSLDIIGDITRKFMKKKDREDPKLIIRDTRKKRYTLVVKDSCEKSRGFVKDMINTLRNM